ncbi:MAG: hypothetical protein AABW72_00335 [archaeon]
MKKPSLTAMHRRRLLLRNARKLRFRRRAAMQRALKTSPTYYKDRVDPKAYSFEETNKWFYKDRYQVSDEKGGMSMGYAKNYNPHLILKDSHGTPRVTLQYVTEPERIVIKSIQRERTNLAYEGIVERDVPDFVRDDPFKDKRGPFYYHGVWGDASRYSPERERVESKKFAEQLGMHSSEFILCEFLHRMRDKIKEERTVVLDLSSWLEAIVKTYRPLIDRFFHKKPIERTHLYELNLGKKKGKANPWNLATNPFSIPYSHKVTL